MRDLLGHIAVGGLAGCLASIPMSVWMEARRRTLSAMEQGPLPPRPIVLKSLKTVVDTQELSTTEKDRVALAGHFLYGSAMGGIYGAAVPARCLSGALAGGVAFGSLVWFTSYFGWLPAAHLYVAARDTHARNSLMLESHILWGATMGALAFALRRRQN